MNQRYASVSMGVLVGWCVFLMVDVAVALQESHSPFFPGEDYRLALGTCEPTSRVILSQHPAVGSVTFYAQGVTLTLRMSTNEENSELRRLHRKAWREQDSGGRAAAGIRSGIPAAGEGDLY